LIAFLFLGEIMRPLQLVGVGLVVASIVVLQIGKEKR
jgi:drug/metabolite transporter (DMT)-like permease